MPYEMPTKGPATEGYTEAARIRQMDSDAAAERSRVSSPPTAGAASLLGQTVAVSTYPTTAAVYYGITPVGALGTQTEGSAGTFTPGTATFFALNLGTEIPPVGTLILLTLAGNRWVFRYD
jgi:hypothetical protein